jgi:hypothetical protein
MDMGNIVAWIQAGIWISALVLWLGRVLRGDSGMPGWIRRAGSSNKLIGAVVVLGLVMSGISLYVSYTVNAIPKPLMLNVSAYDPPYPAPMRVISDRTFEDQDVPLDGFIYQRCTFVNVCFLFDGGAYGLQDSAVKNHWKVCAKDQRIRNCFDLMDAMKLLSPKLERAQKTFVNH